MKVLTIIVVCFALSSGPKQCSIFLYATGLISFNFTGTMYTAFLFFSYMMCCINPIIFLSKYQDFQKGVKWVVCQKKESNTIAACALEVKETAA